MRSSINWDNLRDCIDGQQGDRFLVAYSHKTFNLNPNHNYIPWIVIDGKHSDQMQREGERNLIKYLCDNHYNHVSETSHFDIFSKLWLSLMLISDLKSLNIHLIIIINQLLIVILNL